MSKDALMLTYSNILTVKTRGVYQLVLEAPIEGMQEAMELLGPPISASEVWVAVARLKAAGELPKPQEALPAPSQHRYSGQAAMMCNKPAFCRWIIESTGYQARTPEEAANWLRVNCGVSSRSDLDRNPAAAALFVNIKADFNLWLSGVGE